MATNKFAQEMNRGGDLEGGGVMANSISKAITARVGTKQVPRATGKKIVQRPLLKRAKPTVSSAIKTKNDIMDAAKKLLKK